MDKSLPGLLAAALLALMIGGCAAPPMVDRMAGAEPEVLLREASQQDAAQAADTRLEAATILARRGDDTQAMGVLGELDDRQLGAKRRIEWALLLSRLATEQEDDTRVLQATAVLDEGLPLSRRDATTLRYRRGLALGRIDEPLASAQALLDVQAATSDEELNDAIWQQLSRLGARERNELASDADALTAGWLALLELQRASGGDIDRLLAGLDDWRGRFSDHPAARRLPGDLTALRELRGKRVERIAVLLPESGPLADVARQVRRGIEVRHAAARRAGDSAPSLSFIDSSQGDLESLYAKAAMDGAQVVIGPLSKDKVSELERRRRVPLPTLALNYGTAPRNGADNLFQYGLSVEDEARQVALRASRDGHRQAAALVPDNDWGRRVGNTFRQAWQDQGGEVATLSHYNPEAPVTDTVRRLVAQSGGIDMLFLLALPSYARQVPPNLDYHYTRGLPVYATSQVYEGQPQPRVDRDLDDVLFVEIPWLIPDAAVGGDNALPFADSYRELSEEADPSLLKLRAMGVDAFELGRRLPQFQAIRGSELFGATGTLHAADDGRIVRQLPWAQFTNGVPQLPLRALAPKESADDGRTE